MSDNSVQTFLGQIEALAQNAADQRAAQAKEEALAAFDLLFADKAALAMHRAAQETLTELATRTQQMLTEARQEGVRQILDIESRTGVHQLPALEIPAIQVPSLNEAMNAARSGHTDMRYISSGDDVTTEVSRALGL